MFFILLDEQFRVKANEIVKQFLPEKSYLYVELQPALSPEDVLLHIEVALLPNESMVSGSLRKSNQILVQREVPVQYTHSIQKKDLNMSVKLLIYSCLSQYTGKVLPWGALTGIRPVKIVNTLLAQGETFDAIEAKMMGEYRVTEEKTKLAIEVALNEREFLTCAPHAISVYIHIPFCTSRCLYCSFPSVSTQQHGHWIGDYLQALTKEIQWTAQWIRAQHLNLDTIYIGGGTPTALHEEALNKLLNDLIPTLPMDRLREFTVEAGRPDTINRQKLQIMHKAGVSRISINPQTMQDKTLQRIGRYHTSEQIKKAFQMAREEGFTDINCDLIAGLPGETLEDFKNTLSQIRELNPENLTVHTMSMKRASRLHEEKNQFSATADDIVSAMISYAGVFARGMGLRPYYLYRQKNILANLENVGYARPGFEGIYNILIMEEIQTILALGAGATSKIVWPDNKIERIFNLRSVEQYIQRIDEMIDRKRQMLEK